MSRGVPSAGGLPREAQLEQLLRAPDEYRKELFDMATTAAEWYLEVFNFCSASCTRSPEKQIKCVGAVMDKSVRGLVFERTDGVVEGKIYDTSARGIPLKWSNLESAPGERDWTNPKTRQEFDQEMRSLNCSVQWAPEFERDNDYYVRVCGTNSIPCCLFGVGG